MPHPLEEVVNIRVQTNGEEAVKQLAVNCAGC
jgi:DNA-directed RNA polymerase subunit L